MDHLQDFSSEVHRFQCLELRICFSQPHSNHSFGHITGQIRQNINPKHRVRWNTNNDFMTCPDVYWRSWRQSRWPHGISIEPFVSDWAHLRIGFRVEMDLIPSAFTSWLWKNVRSFWNWCDPDGANSNDIVSRETERKRRRRKSRKKNISYIIICQWHNQRETDFLLNFIQIGTDDRNTFSTERQNLTKNSFWNFRETSPWIIEYWRVGWIIPEGICRTASALNLTRRNQLKLRLWFVPLETVLLPPTVSIANPLNRTDPSVFYLRPNQQLQLATLCTVMAQATSTHRAPQLCRKCRRRHRHRRRR